MATTFVNNWKNIIGKLENILKSEFGNTLPVYRGHEDNLIGNQYLQLNPVGSELIEYAVKQEIRQYNIQMFYKLIESKMDQRKLDNAMRIIARIESLIVDNINITYTNESSTSETAYNCRIESTNFNVGDEDDIYSVELNWSCLHRGNTS